MLTVVGTGAGDRTQTRDRLRPFLLARVATQLTLAAPPPSLGKPKCPSAGGKFYQLVDSVHGSLPEGWSRLKENQAEGPTLFSLFPLFTLGKCRQDSGWSPAEATSRMSKLCASAGIE